MKRTIVDYFKSKDEPQNKLSKTSKIIELNNTKNVNSSTCSSSIIDSSNECVASTSRCSQDLQEKDKDQSNLARLYDIGLALKKTLSDEEKNNKLTNTWEPDNTYDFPLQLEGKQHRRFKIEWMSRYKWLAYSEAEKFKGAYCKICVLFGPSEAGVGGQAVKTLVKEPLTKYKKAVELFQHHQSTNYHTFSMVKASNFKKNFEGTTSIAVQLDRQKSKIIDDNRKRLRPIIKTIIFCANNNLPLRGHRDDGELLYTENTPGTGTMSNQGVFRNLLAFRIDAGDEDLRYHLNTAKKNATMISKTIQNEIIEVLGVVIRGQIVQDIKKSMFFSILCDETTDVSTKEQMTFCVRYLDTDNYIIKEEFLGFIEVKSTTGKDIKNAIYKKLTEEDLSIVKLRGQGYDGGSNMSGKFNGVQALIREDQKLALYTHCFSHSLNLCISKSCEVPAIRNMMGILASVSTFISASVKRVGMLEKSIHDSNISETNKCKLKALCNTRWVERHESVLTFKQLFLPILRTLEELEGDRDANTSSKSAMFSSSLKRSDFIISLHILSYCLSHTLTLSKFLQSPQQDLLTASAYVDHVKSIFENMRTQNVVEFQSIYNEASELVNAIGAAISMPRVCSRQTQRSNFNATNSEEYFRTSIFNPFVDHIISQIGARFEGISSVIALEGFIPAHFGKHEDAKIFEAAQFYEDDLPGSILELRSEMKIWQQKWRGNETLPKTAIEALKECDERFFPNLQVLLHIFAILPVTTATAERSFSVLRRLKTYLRSTMGAERLNGLALAHINKSREITVDSVIDMFCKIKPRRLEMENWHD